MTKRLDRASSVCHTAGCVSAAADVLRFIDTSIDPCDDFYDFACGKFLSETTLTDEKVSVDTFSIARDKMQSQLLRLVDSPVEPQDIEYCDFDAFLFTAHFDSSIYRYFSVFVISFVGHFNMSRICFRCAWTKLELKKSAWNRCLKCMHYSAAGLALWAIYGT